MDNTSPKLKRIAIIGTPGSGKSSFALQLGSFLNLPVHHLDTHQFDGRKKREKALFMKIQKSLLQETSWVIEGCSQSTFEMRFKVADTVIVLLLPRHLCIWRCFKRLLIQDKRLKLSGCLDGVNWTLIKYIWNFEKKTTPIIHELRAKYPHVNCYTFRKQSELDQFLKTQISNK